MRGMFWCQESIIEKDLMFLMEAVGNAQNHLLYLIRI